MRSAYWAAVAVVLAGVAACSGGGDSGSGGGGGGTSPPPAPNQPPAFTSPTEAFTRENTIDVIYVASATDPDGGALTFSIAGGADAAAFRITPAGALSFATPPNYENPADATADNVYHVTIRVTDGQAAATLNLSVFVQNVVGEARVRRVGAGFNQPLFLAGLVDGSGRVYVIQKGGQILILNPATGLAEPTAFLNLSNVVSTDGERGLLGFALSPDFAANRTFYVYITNLAGDIEVRRYQASAANPNVADPASGDVILTFDHPPATDHNGGWIGFGPDGLLHIASGDGGSTPNAAQDANSLLGKMLRIDVRTDAFPADPARDYAIPSGNPFATGGGAPEIWALGLRNPFRAGFDPVSGDLFIGDVGQSAREEIDRLPPSAGGANLGWPFFEGTETFSGSPPPGFVHTVPVTEYERGSGVMQGETVIGGLIYRGAAESLRNHYLFADFIDGHVWSLPETSLVPGTTTPSAQFIVRDSELSPDFGAINSPVAFGTDAAGNVYIVDLDGDIFRIDAVE
jgi:glucose/arabinose dehydrogenase